MSDKDEKKTKKKPEEPEVISLPGPMRMVWGAIAAYCLRDIINPAFTMIAFMFLMMIPVIIADIFFPDGEPKKKETRTNKSAIDEIKNSMKAHEGNV